MSAENDIALLRRFEPVIHYTRGERFFPMSVESYVRACSLWVRRPDEMPVCLVPAGEMTIEKLIEPRPDEFGAIQYLKIAEPLSIAELAARTLTREHLKDPQNVFRAGQGRLARVGYLSRVVDAIFSITLLARGRVSGDAAASAVTVYQRTMADAARACRCYYGRVVHSGQTGWVALQYWFLYAFNDWRSGFFGVNDHEADWEMIYVYLSESKNGELRPEWVAYAVHDFSGDDLRRRWDDPEVEKVGEHPVIYAGAGSHASYYARGEYMIEVELPFFAPLGRVIGTARRFWRGKLSQYSGGGVEQAEVSNAFRVPFVDYARGDGVSIGPGQPYEWDTPGLLEPPPAWAAGYRGLWGLYAQDLLGGENAPSGPVYSRDGTVRRSWHDPLGWAGLDKVPTPEQELDAVLAQQVQVQARQESLAAKIEEKVTQLKQLGVEAAAMRGQPHLGKAHAAHLKQIHAQAQEVAQLRKQMAFEQALLESLQQHAGELRAGERGPLRAHIHRAHHPTPSRELRAGRLAEFWAAVSIGLMLLTFVGLMFFARNYMIWGLVAIVSLFTFIESGFRRQLTNLVSSLAIGLAVVAALVLLREFFWHIVSLAVLVAGGYILFENLREFWT
jgi:hypothetical protein